MNHARTTLLILLGIALGLAGWFYFDHARQHPDTADAYIGMHVARIAAQVDGPITAVHVHNHQTVKAGDPLFDVDAEPYRLAVEQARARLRLATQQSEAAQARVEAAEARVSAARAALRQADRHADRIATLARQEVAASDTADAAREARQDARDQLTAARAQRTAARAERGRSGADNAAVQAAQAALARAELDLAHCRIKAPVDGVIGNLDLRVGSYVRTGEPLFALVDTGHVWVDANFKETALTRLHPGQPARIDVDLAPAHVYQGVVDSISPASGAAFALLPAENATGNWVKVTQRFTVRVRVLDPDPALRLGASAEVQIDASDQG